MHITKAWKDALLTGGFVGLLSEAPIIVAYLDNTPLGWKADTVITLAAGLTAYAIGSTMYNNSDKPSLSKGEGRDGAHWIESSDGRTIYRGLLDGEKPVCVVRDHDSKKTPYFLSVDSVTANGTTERFVRVVRGEVIPTSWYQDLDLEPLKSEMVLVDVELPEDQKVQDMLVSFVEAIQIADTREEALEYLENVDKRLLRKALDKGLALAQNAYDEKQITSLAVIP